MFQKKCLNAQVLIDCTDIFTGMPASNQSQSATFSSYRYRNTVKVLTGITPSVPVSLVSDLNAGRNSDKQITDHFGIL